MRTCVFTACVLLGCVGVVGGRPPGLASGIRRLPGASGRARRARPPGALILVRNGLPDWALTDEQFIGWADPDLSEEGQLEVRSAARLLLEAGYTIDCVHTSMMKRSIRTVWIILHELERIYLPVLKDWRLAARRCGALTGLSEPEIDRLWGPGYVERLRGDLHMRPPPASEAPDDAQYTATPERDFPHLRNSDDILPTESLGEAFGRCDSAWKPIQKELASGKNVLVVGHQTSLCALIAQLEDLDHEEARRLMEFPRGCPVIYRFERAPAGQLRVLPPSASPRNAVNSFCAQAAARGAEDGKDAPILPKFGDFLAGPSDLERLALQQTPLRDAPQCITSGAFGTDLCAYDDPFSAAAKGGAKASETAAARAAEVETGFATVALNGERAESTYQDAFVPLQEAGEGGRVQRRDGQIVVIIRHGKTEQNKLGLFTGWMDVPLAAEGAVEAMRAGQLLREHGIHFDLVYASWLSRSISTAWLVLEQLDALWLPIIKSWRLNERMYGRLTSLSKRMIRTKYGEEQFRLWRRGYDTRPPPISSFSPLYPGNDDRYVTYVTDVRNSVRETVIRSIEAGQLELHPKLPKAESLKDCMERTIPFWSDVIVPEAISNGKNVLISSSENAIRGLMMHLCDIPPDKIVGVEIPTGVPLVYDVQSKCIRLLDDGSGVTDPLSRYNFGSSGHLLFQPCAYDAWPDVNKKKQPKVAAAGGSSSEPKPEAA